MCVKMLMHVTAATGCMDTVRESTLKADCGRKIPCCTEKLNPYKYCIWLLSPTLHQLSYLPYTIPQTYTIIHKPRNTNVCNHISSPSYKKRCTHLPDTINNCANDYEHYPGLKRVFLVCVKVINAFPHLKSLSSKGLILKQPIMGLTSIFAVLPVLHLNLLLHLVLWHSLQWHRGRDIQHMKWGSLGTLFSCQLFAVEMKQTNISVPVMAASC